MAAEDAVSSERLVFRRGFNPAYWYGVFGLIVLGATFWFPFASAQRTARVEGRADGLARVLLEVGSAAAPIDWDDPGTREMVFARVLRACEPAGVYVGDLELLPDVPGFAEITLRNKHYLAQLRPSPNIDPSGLETAAPGSDADGDQPLEALSWPVAATGAGHAAFFYPETAEPAYTRNLQIGYFGADPAGWPAPGITQRRPNSVWPWEYRAFDDERWLLTARPGDLRNTRTGSP